VLYTSLNSRIYEPGKNLVILYCWTVSSIVFLYSVVIIMLFRHFLWAWGLPRLAQVITNAVPLFASTVLNLQRVCGKMACFCSKFTLPDGSTERQGRVKMEMQYQNLIACITLERQWLENVWFCSFFEIATHRQFIPVSSEISDLQYYCLSVILLLQIKEKIWRLLFWCVLRKLKLLT